MKLNNFAIYSVKSIIIRTVPSYTELTSNFNNCHFLWLESVSNRNDFTSLVDFVDLLNCSYIYVPFVYSKFPYQVSLAKIAVDRFPKEIDPLFWLAESNLLNEINSNSFLIEESNKEIFLKILSMNPKEGLAWCKLGNIYNKEGDIEKAINSFSQCCKNYDPGMNGCVNAGRLLEAQGDYIDAINYYRLSIWQLSQKEADRLEAQLVSGELNP
ncbi:MAG: tetratricopeptide repeat protein [Anaerolineaceae bacterium]